MIHKNEWMQYRKMDISEIFKIDLVSWWAISESDRLFPSRLFLFTFGKIIRETFHQLVYLLGVQVWIKDPFHNCIWLSFRGAGSSRLEMFRRLNRGINLLGQRWAFWLLFLILFLFLLFMCILLWKLTLICDLSFVMMPIKFSQNIHQSILFLLEFVSL